MSATATIGDLNSFIEGIIKRAEESACPAKTVQDPPTNHPIGDVGTEVPATEGQHSAETEAELKAEVGETAVPNNPSPAPAQPKGVDNGTMNVTGPDETAPGGQPPLKQKDPGTTAAATSEINTSSSTPHGDGATKYSSWDIETVSQLGNDILAKIAVLGVKAAEHESESEEKKEDAGEAAGDKKEDAKSEYEEDMPSKDKDMEYKSSAAAGKKAAANLVDSVKADTPFEKLAEEEKALVSDVIKAASVSADKVADFLGGLSQGAAEAASDAPKAAPKISIKESLRKAAMGDAYGGMAGAGGGEVPPEVAAAAMGGGMPGGEEGGGEGDMSEEDIAALAQLLEQVMQETGKSPEEILMALEEMGAMPGGEEGGMPGGEYGGVMPGGEEGGGMPPIESPKAASVADPAKKPAPKLTPECVKGLLSKLAARKTVKDKA